jgi:hypothetical protein
MNPVLLLPIAVLAFASSAFGQERQQLEKRRSQLEAELAKVTERLEAIERSGTSPQVDETAGPEHFIDAFGVYTVNSAGGVEPSMTLRNPNQRSPIKYARVAIQLFDRVGKLQTSSIGGGSPTKWLSFTGPLKYEDAPDKGRWDPVWYNHSGWCIKITQIQIDFLDGSKRSFSGNTLTKAIKSGLDNSCPVDGPRYRE